MAIPLYNGVILIEWYQTDWFYYLPIILVLLLSAILLLRIIRRLTRWRPVDISHVAIIKEKSDPNGLIFYVRKNSMEESHDSLMKKIIDPLTPSLFLIPSLGVNPEKKNNFAASLTVAGWNVIVLPKETLVSWINSQKVAEHLATFFEKYPIRAGIVFDYACPLINSNLNQINPKIRWIFIRPTWSWDHIQPMWTSIPFSILWWAKLEFNSFRKQINVQKFTELGEQIGKSTPESLEDAKSKNLFLLHSASNWLNKDGNDCINRWHTVLNQSEPPRSIRITDSDWTFFPQETLLFGWILRYLFEQKL